MWSEGEIASSWEALQSNRLRSSLALLGLAVAAATTVASLAFLQGLRSDVSGEFSVMGQQTFVVRRWPAERSANEPLTLRRELPWRHGDLLNGLAHVEAVSVEAHSQVLERLATRTRATTASVAVLGVTPEYERANGTTVAAGRFLSEIDGRLGLKVVFLGADVARVLFPVQDAVGESVRIRGVPFRVIGVARREGAVLGATSRDAYALLPLQAYNATIAHVRDHVFTVVATDRAAVPDAMDEVVALLRRMRGLRPDQRQDFEVERNDAFSAKVDALAGAVTSAVLVLGALLFGVSGVGVMNVMMASAAERTREIGVKMALGARRTRILAQVLTEALVLSISGGGVGTALGAGLAVLVREALKVPADVSAEAVGAALAVSVVTGLAAGAYPAVAASRVAPIDAIRSE